MTRRTFEPYGQIIRMLDDACSLLSNHLDVSTIADDERTRLHGSLDSIRFERKIISTFELSKTEGAPGNQRKPL